MNELTPEDEKKMLGSTGKPWSFVSSVWEKNVDRCIECETVKVNSLDDFNPTSAVMVAHTIELPIKEVIDK